MGSCFKCRLWLAIYIFDAMWAGSAVTIYEAFDRRPVEEVIQIIIARSDLHILDRGKDLEDIPPDHV